MAAHSINQADLESFSAHLKSSNRILALCGAGLSASSGLPTFRGAGGLWRKHDAKKLATPQAFRTNPSLVWQFYSYRRHMALNVKPNAAHYALAELARKKEGLLTLTQNVDGLYDLILADNGKAHESVGLSPRAGHDPEKIKYLHGSLFDVKCSSSPCTWKQTDNFVDPIVPALAIPTGESEPPLPSKSNTSPRTTKGKPAQRSHGKPKELDISDERVKLAQIPNSDLPQCPECHNISRPGVVWFNELLPKQALDDIDKFIDTSPKIDLMIVIGTSASVWPAAGYLDHAKSKGARIAVVNMDPNTAKDLDDEDWFFEGDAAEIVPALFKGEIGDIEWHTMQMS